MWCELCGAEVTQEDADDKCPYWACPISPIKIVDTGDDLHQALGEALKAEPK